MKSAKKRRECKPDAPLVIVNFKADPATVEAIDELADAAKAGGVLSGERSYAIRRAILDAAARGRR